MTWALLAVAATACGSSGGDGRTQRDDAGRTQAPAPGGSRDDQRSPARPRRTPLTAPLGFPEQATKNTTRVGGADAVIDAADVALAVFPSRSRETRPAAVTLVDAGDWRTAISSAQLMSRPLRAPILFTRDGRMPPATSVALDALAPTGAPGAGGAQVIQVAGAAPAPGRRLRALSGADYAARARAVDRLQATAAGKPSRSVLIAPADEPSVAMPAAGWAAKSGTPVLWVQGARIPPATRAAIRDHGRPRIYLLGSESAIPRSVFTQLAKLGRVERIAARGRNGVSTAVAFARYGDAGFGWNVVDPGHGFVFARPTRPLDAAAAAPLSASGTYGPLLLLSSARRLDEPVANYLLDVQPGYTSDPVRGVYNHGWLVGDDTAISVDVQARIDALLEIAPVDPKQPSP